MKKRWNLATLAAACSTMGFCIATGQDPVTPKPAGDIRAETPESLQTIDDQNDGGVPSVDPKE